MGVYADRIGPRLIKCLCSSPDIAAERAAIVPQASGVVLEIGFGPGLNLSHYDPGKIERVIGVDPNEGFLRLGSGARPPVPVEVFRAPAEAIPLPDDVADTAIVTYTLCSVEDPARALGEVRRVLKPGGRVLFVEHGRASEAGVARWQDRLTPLWRRLAVDCNLNRPVVGLLQEAGFGIEVLDQHYLRATPRPIGFLSCGSARSLRAAA
jgi:ubiquinone/menaquinone biosynthesis C-methylase UbiE